MPPQACLALATGAVLGRALRAAATTMPPGPGAGVLVRSLPRRGVYYTGPPAGPGAGAAGTLRLTNLKIV